MSTIEGPPPDSQLFFSSIKADDPSLLQLDFILELNNIDAESAKLESWQIVLNGRDGSRAFSLEANPVFLLNTSSESPDSFPLTLNMDVEALVAEGLAPEDHYEVSLSLHLSYGQNERLEVSGVAAFPGVLAPEFHIINIAILKAELVNTRFRVGIRIVNPNPFGVELSSFNYELYGNGRFWAEGAERNIIEIPGKSAVEGYLFMLMNFIGMERSLLDQIINLVDVNYRFAGEALVSTGVMYLPGFNTAFDLSGYSQVLEN